MYNKYQAIELDGVKVTIYRNDDGHVSIQVDTPKNKHINEDETPRVRVWLNDYLQYDGTPEEDNGWVCDECGETFPNHADHCSANPANGA